MLLPYLAFCCTVGSNISSYTQVPLSLVPLYTFQNIFFPSSTSGFETSTTLAMIHSPTQTIWFFLVKFPGSLHILCSFPHACCQNGLFCSVHPSNSPCHLEASSSSSFATKFSLFMPFHTNIFFKNHIGFHSFLFHHVALHCSLIVT